MKRNFICIFYLLCALLVPTAAFGQAVKITPAERRSPRRSPPTSSSSYLYFVASDAMGGRDTPSDGLDVTAEFLKMNLSAMGL